MTAHPAAAHAVDAPPAELTSKYRRWSADVLLGARLSVGGGRASWTRLVLTALSVGMCVALLLIAASVGPARQARNARAASLQPTTLDLPGIVGPPALEVHPVTLYSGSLMVTGVYVAALAENAPAPPGLGALPRPGELILSPALARLLASPAGAGLRPRLQGTVVATIGAAGLVDPGDLRFYRGMSPTSGTLSPSRVASGWGVPTAIADTVSASTSGASLDQLTVPVLVAGTTILIVPLLLLVAMSSRLGGAARDRRLAAMRLVGATACHIRRITTGEVLVAAGAGLLLGAGGFLIARQAARWIPLAGRTFFPSDISPTPGLTIGIVVIVPLLAVVAALGALRGAIVEPLGVTRINRGRPRRLAWRLLFLAAAAVAILATERLRGQDPPASLTISTALIPAITLAMICIPVFVPYVIEKLARRLSGGNASWQLAVRRLQLDSGTAGRVCSGIAVVLAGAVALLPLLAYAAERAEATRQPQSWYGGYQLFIDSPTASDITAVPSVITDATPQAAPTIAWSDLALTTTDDLGASTSQASVVGCPSILLMTNASTCRDGDVFAISDAWSTAPPAGTKVLLTGGGSAVGWQVPADIRTVSENVAIPAPIAGLVITPGALSGQAASLHEHLPMMTVGVGADGTAALTADQLDQVRNSLADYGWRVSDSLAFTGGQLSTIGQLLTTIRAGLIVGGGLVLLVAALGLVVTAVEQTTERRRALTMAVASGVPRSVLGRSLLLGTAIPATIAFVIADVAGLAIPLAIQPLLITPLHTSVAGLLGLTAAGLLLVTAATALALPALRRLTRPGALRTE